MATGCHDDDFLITATTKVSPGGMTENNVFVSWRDDQKEAFADVRYLLYAPDEFDLDAWGPSKRRGSVKWPLVLFLHGLGESGHDLSRVKIHGLPRLADAGAKFPFILVAPQCELPELKDETPGAYRQAWNLQLLAALLDHLQESLPVDRQRVYVTGLSMGGFGTWRLLSHAPDRFAAAMPICGGGDPAAAKAIARTPIWCFHGALDDVVDISESQRMVTAVRAAGGQVKFTVYNDLAHDSWTRTYDNPQAIAWLLRHRKPDK